MSEEEVAQSIEQDVKKRGRKVKAEEAAYKELREKAEAEEKALEKKTEVKDITIKFVPADAEAFFRLLAVFHTVTDEPTITFKRESMTFRAMDPSHVMMIDAELPRTHFNEYSVPVKDDGSEKATFSLAELLKKVKPRKDELLNVEANGKRLTFQFRRSGFERMFDLILLTPDGADVPVPKLKLEAHAKIVSSALKDALLDLGKFGDYVKLESDGIMMKLSCQEQDLGKGYITFYKSSEELLMLEVGAKPQKATYYIKSVLEFVKAAAEVADVMTLNWSDSLPIQIQLEMGVAGRVDFYQAPYKDD